MTNSYGMFKPLRAFNRPSCSLILLDTGAIVDDRKRRRDQAYCDLLQSIRDRALRFLQVAPAMERRGEIEAVTRSREVSACRPEICSIELLRRGNQIIVRCHTCKRGGTWRYIRQEDAAPPRLNP